MSETAREASAAEFGEVADPSDPRVVSAAAGLLEAVSSARAAVRPSKAAS